jgi:hypothetical protein
MKSTRKRKQPVAAETIAMRCHHIFFYFSCHARGMAVIKTLGGVASLN